MFHSSFGINPSGLVILSSFWLKHLSFLASLIAKFKNNVIMGVGKIDEKRSTISPSGGTPAAPGITFHQRRHVGHGVGRRTHMNPELQP
jgi:hypothetical protein